MDCAEYFYIASHANVDLVIDVGEPQDQDIPLVLRGQNGRRSQLWKWKCNATITNKRRNCVIDVKKSLRKAGRIVIANSIKDDTNQGWHLIDDHIISNRHNLALGVKGDGARAGAGLHLSNISETPSQQWIIVPELAWDHFQAAYGDSDLLEIAKFWHCLATNYIDVIMGCSFDEYKDHVEVCTSTIDNCANKLDSVTTDTGITKTVGGGAAIVGGTALLGGLLLAPFTAGTSLVLTVGGAAVGALGGVTTLTANIVDQVWEKKKKDQMKRAITPAITATLNLQNFLNRYHTSMEKALRTVLKAMEGSEKLKLRKMIKTPTNAVVAGYTAFAIGKAAFRGIKHTKRFATIPKFLSPIDDLNALRIGAATDAAAPGFGVLGKSVVATGSTAAKGISGSLAVVGIAFGIWDVYSGAKQITSKSELAQEFRESAKSIRDNAENFVNIYYQIIENSTNEINDIDGIHTDDDSDDTDTSDESH